MDSSTRSQWLLTPITPPSPSVWPRTTVRTVTPCGPDDVDVRLWSLRNPKWQQPLLPPCISPVHPSVFRNKYILPESDVHSDFCFRRFLYLLWVGRSTFHSDEIYITNIESSKIGLETLTHPSIHFWDFIICKLTECVFPYIFAPRPCSFQVLISKSFFGEIDKFTIVPFGWRERVEKGHNRSKSLSKKGVTISFYGGRRNPIVR